jgi:hypothetical protein
MRKVVYQLVVIIIRREQVSLAAHDRVLVPRGISDFNRAQESERISHHREFMGDHSVASFCAECLIQGTGWPPIDGALWISQRREVGELPYIQTLRNTSNGCIFLSHTKLLRFRPFHSPSSTIPQKRPMQRKQRPTINSTSTPNGRRWMAPWAVFQCTIMIEYGPLRILELTTRGNIKTSWRPLPPSSP